MSRLWKEFRWTLALIMLGWSLALIAREASADTIKRGRDLIDEFAGGHVRVGTG